MLNLNTDIEKLQEAKLKKVPVISEEGEEEDFDLDSISDILDLTEEQYPRFTLAKNKK